MLHSEIRTLLKKDPLHLRKLELFQHLMHIIYYLKILFSNYHQEIKTQASKGTSGI